MKRIIYIFLAVLLAQFVRPAAADAALSPKLKEMWKLENKAVELTFEIRRLERDRVREIVEIVFEKGDEDAAEEEDSSKSSPWGSFFQGLDSLDASYQAPTAQETVLEIVLNQKYAELDEIDSKLDSEYLEIFSGRAEESPRTKSDKDLSGSGQQSMHQMSGLLLLQKPVELDFAPYLLYLTTQLRRKIGMSLYTDVAGLAGAPVCDGDIIKDQPILKYGLSLLEEDYPYAVVELHFLARQVKNCISSIQLVFLDIYLYEAIQMTLEKLPDDVDVKDFLELIANPTYIVYQAGASQFSLMYNLISAYSDVFKDMYVPGSYLHKAGFYLIDDHSNRLEKVIFSGKSKGLWAKEGGAQFANGDVYFGAKTPYGAIMEDLQSKNCGGGGTAQMPQLPDFADLPTSGWGDFVDASTNPTSLGMGESFNPLTKGFASTVGVCPGGEGGGGDGGKAACGLVPPQSALKVLKTCYMKAPPINAPAPASSGGQASSIDSSAGGSQQFTTLSGGLCPGGSSTGAGKDKVGKKKWDKKEKPINPGKKKQDKAKDDGKKKGAKKQEDLDKASGGKNGKEDKAKKKADKAVDKAKVVKGLKKTVVKKGDGKLYEVYEHDGGTIHERVCTGCSEGQTTMLDGVALTDGNGDTDIFFNEFSVENGSLDGEKTAAEVVQHEWGHAYLFGKGKSNKNGAHHEYYDKAGVKYCAAYSDGCSDECNAGEYMLGLFYDCPEQAEPEKMVTGMPDFCDPIICDPSGPGYSASMSGGQQDGSLGGVGMGGGSGGGMPDWCLVVNSGEGFPSECDGMGIFQCSINGAGVDITKLPGYGIVDPKPHDMMRVRPALERMRGAKEKQKESMMRGVQKIPSKKEIYRQRSGHKEHGEEPLDMEEKMKDNSDR